MKHQIHKLALIPLTFVLFGVIACTPKPAPVDLTTPVEVTPIQISVVPQTPSEDTTEEKLIKRIALAALVTLKEKNWTKQYDRLLSEESKALFTEEEYAASWDSEFKDVPIKVIRIPEEDSIQYEENKTIDALGKTFPKVAKLSPIYILADESTYTPKAEQFKTLYFAPNADGSWLFLWWEK